MWVFSRECFVHFGVALLGVVVGCGRVNVEDLRFENDIIGGTASGAFDGTRTESDRPTTDAPSSDNDGDTDSQTISNGGVYTETVSDTQTTDDTHTVSDSEAGTTTGVPTDTVTGNASDSAFDLDTDTATPVDTASTTDIDTETTEDSGTRTDTPTDSSRASESDSSVCPTGTTALSLNAFQTGQTGSVTSSWQYDGLLWTTGGLTGRYESCESSFP